MKKVKLLFIGAISLVVFGFLLPQPIPIFLSAQGDKNGRWTYSY